MDKTILITVSDDRMGRKDGGYRITQDKIKELFDLNNDFGFVFQEHIDFNQFSSLATYNEATKAFLNNIDPARNGRIYKPMFIKARLDELNMGDFLVYNDCSPEIWNLPVEQLDKGTFNLDVIKSLCVSNNDFLTAFVKWDDKPLQKGDLGRHTHKHFTMDISLNTMYDYYGVGGNKFHDSYLCASGMICIRKTKNTTNIVDEWLRLSTIQECISLGNVWVENDYSFWEKESHIEFGKPGYKLGHRHDQSILSFILNYYNYHYVDILYNELNPYNFLNFCRLNEQYEFINSNAKQFVRKSHIDVGDVVFNNKGIKLNVYDVYLRNNIWRYKVGINEGSCFETTGSQIVKK